LGFVPNIQEKQQHHHAKVSFDGAEQGAFFGEYYGTNDVNFVNGQ